MEAPDVTCFWRGKAPFERLKRKLPRGVWGHAPPGNFEKRTFRNVVSSVSGRQVSVSQARLEFTQILFKSKIFDGNGQMVENGGGGGGGWREQNFQLFIIANLFFVDFQKKTYGN